MQNIAGNVLNVTKSLLRREKKIRHVPLGDSRLDTNKTPIQHYNVAHRWIECRVCDREFRTQEAMNQVRFQLSTRRLPADGRSAL